MGVFDDFLAIQPTQGNVSTQSYSDYVLSVGSVNPSNSTRSVTRNPVGGKETDAISNPLAFSMRAPR